MSEVVGVGKRGVNDGKETLARENDVRKKKAGDLPIALVFSRARWKRKRGTGRITPIYASDK